VGLGGSLSLGHLPVRKTVQGAQIIANNNVGDDQIYVSDARDHVMQFYAGLYCENELKE
jgi:hypothetical protein